MSDVLEVMFTAFGTPTKTLLDRSRAKGALRGLQPNAVCVVNGYATQAFRGWWKAAFPTRDPLPLEPIATREGRFTDPMLSIWL